MPSRILVVDDEATIRDIICFALERAGFAIATARDGAEALRAWRSVSPDLIVLDIGMPEMDGLEVCRQIRRTSQVPILFLSARDDEIDRVVGLELGGDDYLIKPFSPRELVARVKAILKRSTGTGAPAAISVHGALRVDRTGHTVTWDGRPVSLTALEFSVLAALLARPEMVFSRDQLRVSAYGSNIHVAERTVDSHIRNIRAKFAALGCDAVITTVYGVGFRIAAAEDGAT